MTMQAKNDETKALGKYISSRRLQLNMTQGDLCRRTSKTKKPLSRSYISRIEAGAVLMPSKETLESIARSLDTTVADLLSHRGYAVSEAETSSTGNPDEFSLKLNSLRSLKLTKAEKEDIMLAIDIALARQGQRKSEALAFKERQAKGQG